MQQNAQTHRNLKISSNLPQLDILKIMKWAVLLDACHHTPGALCSHIQLSIKAPVSQHPCSILT